MHKTITFGLLAAALIPAVAQAQSRGELRDDRRELRDDRRDLARDRANDAPGYARRDDRRDLRDDRREYREDWQDYRRAHPDVYRGAGYVGPRGWAYRPVAVGHRFDPIYYDRRYWVDPARYHLAPVGRNERWVRYGRDVVRIDVRSGRALQVHGGFFF